MSCDCTACHVTVLSVCVEQVWRGAFLLADFILSEADMFRGATVLELGAGMGFTSIVMATVAKTVYCTGVMMNIPDYSEFSRLNKKTMNLIEGNPVFSHKTFIGFSLIFLSSFQH